MKPSVLLFASLTLSLAFPISNSPDSPPSLQQPLLETPDNSKSELISERKFVETINHGTIIYAHKSRIAYPRPSYTYTLNTEQSAYSLLARYSNELFAIGLFLLVPITLGLVEFAERLARSMTVEEFPERGREKCRMGSLRERKVWMVKRKEREMKTGKSRPWWKSSRG
ncbi:hypothetical protein BDV18DRAFT_21794 [Aspergillus unguis]